MNGYSGAVSKLTEAQLAAEIATCSRSWWDYGNPGSDRFYWYKALLEEDKSRKGRHGQVSLRQLRGRRG